MSIKIQINDKSYEAPDAVNLVVKHGVKSIRLVNTIRNVFWNSVQTCAFLAAFMFVWYISGLMHESDIIEACRNNTQFELLHSNYKLEGCTIKLVEPSK